MEPPDDVFNLCARARRRGRWVSAAAVVCVASWRASQSASLEAAEAAPPPAEVRGELELRHVAFAYPARSDVMIFK